MQTQKETDQKPDDVTVIRLLIRLMILRGKSMRTQKETDQETDDVTAIRILIRLMILRGKTCGRKRSRRRSRMTSQPYGS